MFVLSKVDPDDHDMKARLDALTYDAVEIEELDISILSEGVYAGLCTKVGSQLQVETRRSVIEVMELISKRNLLSEYVLGECIFKLMGSRREGFIFSDSDFDVMFWFENYVILPEDDDENFVPKDVKNILFTYKCKKSRPGFFFLEMQLSDMTEYWTTFKKTNNMIMMMTKSSYYHLVEALHCFFEECFGVKDGSYLVSSSGFRLFTENVYSWPAGGCQRSSHGPCLNIKNESDYDLDLTFCYQCNFWPSSVCSWTSRGQNWPPSNVVYEIITSGFHLVPIGSKVSHDSDMEWRMSFSLAEYKLVKSMNHCQFLTYGLMKLFLKEVINKDDSNPVLCSYFMKTILFWEIQEEKYIWSVQTLMHCFWSCFKRLVHWVNKEYCPNFFIPENNMFLGKLSPAAKHLLLDKLNSLYEEGHRCIFKCSTVRSFLNDRGLFNPSRELISKTEVIEVLDDCHFFSEIDQISLLRFRILDLKEFALQESLRNIADFSRRNELECRDIVIIQKYLSQFIFLLISDTRFYCFKGNRLYLMHGRLLQVFHHVMKFSDITTLLYYALLIFERNDISTTLSTIARAKSKLSKPYVIYNNTVNISKYRETFAGKSLYVKFMNASVTDVHVPHTILFQDVLSDLLNDKETGTYMNQLTFFRVPPLVILHTLELFCYNRINDPKQFESLHSLYFLVHFDKGEHIPSECTEIAWYLLGVCQRICGDVEGAIRSFQKVSSLTNPKGFLGLSIFAQLRYCT